MENQVKYNNSEAEDRFYRWMKKEKPDIEITKKGMPDFAEIKEGKIIGFTEVKRDNLDDVLTREQRLFRDFCKEKDIPYKVWSPMMVSERYKKSSDKFRKAMENG